MGASAFRRRFLIPSGIGLIAGAALISLDNFAFEGEVSPIVIAAMLLALSATCGAFWGKHGWVPAVVTWASLPIAHLVKHVFSIPDTLTPNTYTSIVQLAAFTLLIMAVGVGAGLLIRRPARGPYGDR